MPIHSFMQPGAFDPEATTAMSEAYEAASKSFTTPVTLTWCPRPSPRELLQRQDLVSATRFVCGKPRLLGREVNGTSRHSPRQHGLQHRPPAGRKGKPLKPVKH